MHPTTYIKESRLLNYFTDQSIPYSPRALCGWEPVFNVSLVSQRHREDRWPLVFPTQDRHFWGKVIFIDWRGLCQSMINQNKIVLKLFLSRSNYSYININN